MTPRQNAIRLMDIGKRVADLARELHELYPDVKEESLWTMIDNMIKCRDFYPRYAEYLNEKYGFNFSRPEHKQPAREMLKAA